MPARKLFFAAGGYYGPTSGLGVLRTVAVGEMRPVLGHRIVLPVVLPEPFLWELHLSSGVDIPDLRLSLGTGTVLQTALFASRRTEVTGIAGSAPGRARRLEFRLHDDTPEGVVRFLGLSVMSLQDALATDQNIE